MNDTRTLSKADIRKIQPRARKQWVAVGKYRDGKRRKIIMTASERPISFYN